jgi:hypothetical protein
MKAKELIKKLKEVDPELEVMFSCEDGITNLNRFVIDDVVLDFYADKNWGGEHCQLQDAKNYIKMFNEREGSFSRKNGKKWREKFKNNKKIKAVIF